MRSLPPAEHPPDTMVSLLRRLVPLSLSDIVMALGDPLQVMVLTRLPNPAANLAAMGIVKAVANFLESPAIVMLHASTALASRDASRRALWRFMLILATCLTLAFLCLNLPRVYHWLMSAVFRTSAGVESTARIPFLIMVVWPAVIAWRRYFQGLLIDQRAGHCLGLASTGRLVAVGAVLGAGLAWQGPGAMVAAGALVAGIVVEAVLITFFAGRDRPGLESGGTPGLPSTLPAVARFYAPLGTTMLVVWGGRALLMAILSRSPGGTLALAAWVSGWGLVLLVANSTRMVQQIVISSSETTTARLLVKFALVAGAFCSAALAGLGFTPPGQQSLAWLWGNDQELLKVALPVVQLCAPVPLLVAVQNCLQGFLVVGHRTPDVTWATLAGTLTTLGTAWVLCANGVEAGVSGACSMLVGFSLEVGLLAHLLTSRR